MHRLSYKVKFLLYFWKGKKLNEKYKTFLIFWKICKIIKKNAFIFWRKLINLNYLITKTSFIAEWKDLWRVNVYAKKGLFIIICFFSFFYYMVLKIKIIFYSRI